MLDFDMSPYAGYVWPCFLISAAVLAGLVADTLIRARKWKREVERLEAEREG